MEKRRKIIIDTDIGDDIDDAFAILLALSSDKFDILGITTVFRNAENRGKIAKALTASAGVDIPVYVGADTPKDGKTFVFPFESTDERGMPEIPQYFPDMSACPLEKTSAEDFILETADKYPGEVSIVALAPFTNVANAIKKSPERFENIQEILLMGGDGRCNFAEWNVRCDYESAKTVFDCNVKTTVCGFDITMNSALRAEEVERVRALKAEPFRLLVKMMDKYVQDYKGARIPTMHDPLTLCLYLREDLFELERKKFTVSMAEATKGRLCVCENAQEREIVVKANIPEINGYMLDLFEQWDKKLTAEN